MTDTATVEETKTDAPPEGEVSDSGKDEKLAERHGYIDFDKIEDPEVRKQVQDRLQGLYHSQKDTAAAFEESRRMYTAMEKKLAGMEAKAQQKESTAQLAEVRDGIVKANAKGDYETVATLNEKLIDLKTPKPEPKPESTNSGLERQQEAMLMDWQSQMTDDGRIARPWAHPRNARYQETISLLNEVTQDTTFASQGFPAILKEVDRRMAPKPKQAAPVSDGDATPTRPSGKTVQLTEGQRKAAVRLYSKLKPAEAIKAYAEAQKKYGEQ